MAKEGDGDKPNEQGKGIVPKRSNRALTRDWDIGLAKQQELTEATGKALEEIRKIISGADEVNPEMSKQLERLESQFDHLNQSVTDIRVSIGKIDTRLDGIEKNSITRSQAATWALIAGMAIFGAGWWIVQQYLSPLIANLPK